jgi:hypothetical protein
MKKLFLIIVMALVIPSGNNVYGQLRLSLQAGIQAPVGDFANSATTGFGGIATFEYWQNTPLSLIGSIGYMAWGAAGSLPANHDFTTRSIPIMLGIRYYFARGDFHPYFSAELGLHLQQTTHTRHHNPNTTTITTDNRSDFGISPAFGFRYHLGNRIDLDLNLKYNLISGAPSTSFLGANFGVQFGL